MASRFPKFDELVKPCVTIPDAVNPVVLHGKNKKRAWFKDLYSTGNSARTTKPKLECKFYASTGKCRQGSECHFVHNEASKKVIEEPCKYLFMSDNGCKKGDSCHFSHDLSKFSCPYYFGRRDSICPHACGFSHSPMYTEPESMKFVKVYQVYIESLGDEANPKWMFYLKDLTEDEFLTRQTNTKSTNVFNL